MRILIILYTFNFYDFATLLNFDLQDAKILQYRNSDGCTDSVEQKIYVATLRWFAQDHTV